jgi:hypothetical protein
MDMQVLKREVGDAGWRYWGFWWDTAQKPWFDAAIHDKAVLVDESDDFRHFWMGSTHNPDPSVVNDSRVKEYL